MKYSQSDDDGVIGYHAATVQPPMTQPSAAARLPSMNIKPSVFPVIGTKRQGSCFSRCCCAYSKPTRTAARFSSTADALLRNCVRRLSSIVAERNFEQLREHADVDHVHEIFAKVALIGEVLFRERGKRHGVVDQILA